eukprot:m.150036 g.150036  ORF g.150036 m.150036 type:complete len:98 (+) comp14219_c0_seq2:754-1047(+)
MQQYRHADVAPMGRPVRVSGKGPTFLQSLSMYVSYRKIQFSQGSSKICELRRNASRADSVDKQGQQHASKNPLIDVEQQHFAMIRSHRAPFRRNMTP